MRNRCPTFLKDIGASLANQTDALRARGDSLLELHHSRCVRACVRACVCVPGERLHEQGIISAELRHELETLMMMLMMRDASYSLSPLFREML